MMYRITFNFAVDANYPQHKCTEVHYLFDPAEDGDGKRKLYLRILYLLREGFHNIRLERLDESVQGVELWELEKECAGGVK